MRVSGCVHAYMLSRGDTGVPVLIESTRGLGVREPRCACKSTREQGGAESLETLASQASAPHGCAGAGGRSVISLSHSRPRPNSSSERENQTTSVLQILRETIQKARNDKFPDDFRRLTDFQPARGYSV